MLNDFKCGCPVYLACGHTDLRRGIDCLAEMVQTRFRLDPFQNALFLFCGQRKDRLKGLYWKSALGKALHYFKEQPPYLIRYLEDGRLELINNRVERSIKPFVIGRRNFLFANTPLSAQASAVIYSPIEMAKETGLDPFCYLMNRSADSPQRCGSLLSWLILRLR